MAPLHLTPHRANAAVGPRLRSPFLPMLVDSLFRRSDGGGAVGERRDVAGDATAAKAHKTADLTLGILGAALTGLFLLCFVAYNIRLATRGELSATYRRQLRCVHERLAWAGRDLGSCFRPSSWRKLSSGLKWFFSSQNGCWTCACFRAPKNDDDGNNNNTNNSGSDDQATHSRDGSGGGGGSNSPFESHIGPEISHLFKDTDSAVAAVEPPDETHPVLRRDSAMLAVTSAGNAAVAARQHQNQNQLRANYNNNAHPPLRQTMTWPLPPRSPGQQGSANDDERRQDGRLAMADFAAAGPGPEGSMAAGTARPLSRHGPLSSHPMDRQRWYPNHQQHHQRHYHHHHHQSQNQHQQRQQHLAAPPVARGDGPPVLALDLAAPLMRDPGRSQPTSIGSNYCQSPLFLASAKC